MATSPTARLKQLGIELPVPARPVANYVPYKIYADEGYLASGKVMLTSGFVPMGDSGPIHTGKLGDNISLEQGQECARLCTLHALSWLSHHFSGKLDLVAGVMQVRGFVACTPDFYDHPKVLNACSDLLVDIFGEAGRHTRAAVGCPSLPLNVPVEIDFVFQLK